MRKPWSVTTTVRNPGRLRDFLGVLLQLENSDWNHENQKKYQVLLIQNRLYGYENPQFYNNLSQDEVDLIDDYSKEISFETAEKIFNEKNYEDPPMRGPYKNRHPLRSLVPRPHPKNWTGPGNEATRYVQIADSTFADMYLRL